MKYRETKQPQIPVNHCAWCGSYDLGIGWQQKRARVAPPPFGGMDSWATG